MLRAKFVRPGGPPNYIQQKIPGGVVALFDRRCAQSAKGHAAVFEVRFRDRRIFQEVL